MSDSPVTCAMAVAVGTALVVWFGACARIAVTPVSLPLAQRSPSFAGVRFGDSVPDVQRKFASGALETSPYGAPAYRVENVKADGASYDTIIFEFTATHGMQLVFATYQPSSTKAALDALWRALGERPAEVSPASPAEWRTATGCVVRHSAAKHKLILIGPQGAGLEPDIRLRAQSDPNA